MTSSDRDQPGKGGTAEDRVDLRGKWMKKKGWRPPPERRLTRSRRDRMIAGVCGGIAEYFGWDPTLVRIVYFVGSVLSAAFPGTVVYLVLWIVMPEEGLG